jgi:transposase
MERQAQRDAVARHNAESLSGPSDRRRGRRSRLTEGRQATPRALILRGPCPERDGILNWTTLPEDEHAVMTLDGAGRRTGHDLIIPPNATLLRLPPDSPGLNPVEGVLLYLREQRLSCRVHDGYSATLYAIASAWLQLTPESVRSLRQYPWITQVSK